jgi:cell division protein ZapA
MSLEVNEEKLEELKSQLLLMEQDLRNSINEKEALKARNKDMSFKLHNYKYKILDLEKKLIDAQFDLAVEKKDKNPLLR